ncbi:HrpT family type III secretion system protein [Pseudomonas asuensis]|uniref:Type III secretion protein n=1 Tax=Pseudomonas asuensis TaxID=1825787 RepID=A0ABQ2H4U3_9PSED|nr:HrpT family type III secretion system protein [Pseudomonas asuensis]GGM31232.1 type III secretion protein [Pseudomonas asuensis]
MTRYLYLIILVTVSSLAGGCASRSGCADYACDRPDSTDRQLVIWWAQDMRQGLNDRDPQIDFTVVPLRN